MEDGTARALRQATHQLTEMTRMRDEAVRQRSAAGVALKACQDENVALRAQRPPEEAGGCPAQEVTSAGTGTAPDGALAALQTQLEVQQGEILRLQLALAAAQAKSGAEAVTVPPETETPPPTTDRDEVIRVVMPALDGEAVRRGYASGVALAYLVKRDLDTQRALGLEQVPDGVLAGFVAEFRGQSRMSMAEVQRQVRENDAAVRAVTRSDEGGTVGK